MNFSLSEKKNPTCYTIGKSHLQWNGQFGEFQQNQQCFCQNATFYQKDPLNLVYFFLYKWKLYYLPTYYLCISFAKKRGSSYQFLFGSLNMPCLLGAVNKPAELATDKLPLLKYCWEFGNNLLRPFWCLHLYLMTADFPHSFPDFYPVKRIILYLTGSIIQIV